MVVLANPWATAYHRKTMEESRAKYDLGGVSRVSPEAIGVPGQRTFKIILESGAATANLWLEKEQLSQLGIYLQEAVKSLPSSEKAGEELSPEPQWYGPILSLDFKIGKMSLAHNPANNSFLLVVHDQEDTEENDPTVSMWLSVKQAEDLAKEALRLCAAGRPRCFLCGRPIDPDGHNCPRANGHAVLEP